MKRILLLSLALLAALAMPATAAKKKPATVKVSKGTTTLALDKGAADALTSLGITVAPIGNAKAGEAGIAFPITTGKLNAKTYAGSIKHTGGLRLSRGETVVDLRNFTIQIDAAPDLTALAGDQRASIADLDLGEAEIKATKKTLSVGNVTVALSELGANSLNAAFQTDAFKPGLVLGTAAVKTRIVGSTKK